MYNNSKANNKSPDAGRKESLKMDIEEKPRKRTRVKPGETRRRDTSILKTREALYLGGGCKDDEGNYHLHHAYVLLREDWEEYHDFLFAPSEKALLEGRFVAQYAGDCIVHDVLGKVYIKMDPNDFLEVVKNNLEIE